MVIEILLRKRTKIIVYFPKLLDVQRKISSQILENGKLVSLTTDSQLYKCILFCKVPYLGIAKYNCDEARKLFLLQFLTEF